MFCVRTVAMFRATGASAVATDVPFVALKTTVAAPAVAVTVTLPSGFVVAVDALGAGRGKLSPATGPNGNPSAWHAGEPVRLPTLAPRRLHAVDRAALVARVPPRVGETTGRLRQPARSAGAPTVALWR